MKPHSTCPTFLALVWACAAAAAAADAPTNAYAAAGAQTSAYPRVNTSTWYEVDPAWPQRPPEAGWGQVPGVAVDAQDNVWIYTRTNLEVQVYAPDGRYLKGWRAPATNALAHYLRIDPAGCIWMVDVGRHVVTKRSPEDGRVLLTLGTDGVPGCDATHFFKPTDVAFGPHGDLFVSDGYGNARIARFDAQGRFIKDWGRLGPEPGNFSLPHSIVCDSKGRLYLADRNNARIQVFDTDGRLLAVWGDLMVPWGLWLGPNDEIWACGSSPMTWGFDPAYPTAPLGCPPKDQLLVRFDTSGRVLQLWTLPKAADGQETPGSLNWFHGVALDSKGNVYATDIIGRRVQKFVRRQDPAGR